MWAVVGAQLCSRDDLRERLSIDDYADALEYMAAKAKAEADAAQAAQAGMPRMGGRR